MHDDLFFMLFLLNFPRLLSSKHSLPGKIFGNPLFKHWIHSCGSVAHFSIFLDCVVIEAFEFIFSDVWLLDEFLIDDKDSFDLVFLGVTCNDSETGILVIEIAWDGEETLGT